LDRAVVAGEVKDLRRELVLTSLSAACAYVFMIKAAMADGFGLDVADPAVVEAHADTVVELFFHGLVTTAGLEAGAA
jgi:hypothetical protein